MAKFDLNALATGVVVNQEAIKVNLLDGRTVIVPLVWYPRLCHGTARERSNWRLLGEGEGIHWPDLDEDISIRNLLLGQPSRESQASFQRWLNKRLAQKPRKRRRN